jgi:hypothetical protein
MITCASIRDVEDGGASLEMFVRTIGGPQTKLKQNSVALVRKRTIPTERLPLVGEVSANFCG